MRTRPAALLAAAALATALAACSDEPQTGVTDEGVVETPSADQGGGLDAPSGDPLAPTPASS